MELKPGYKLTEVGVIPNDWDVSSFKQQFNISAGGDVNPMLSVAVRDDTHPYPIYSNALTNRGLYGYCSYADHPAHSITITARGLLGVAAYRDHKYTAIGRVLVLAPRQGTTGQFFAEFINNRVRFAVESTGVPQLTAPQVGGYLLAVPPYREQRAIAEALGDVDALLEGLDRLIAKKRDLKQAAMQQLLTGQTRLPGFHGEWKVKRLGDIAEIVMGQSPSSVHYNMQGDGLPLVQGNADVSNRKTVLRLFTTEITKRARDGDTLMSVRAPVGEVSRATFDACMGRGVCAIRFPNDFLHHYLVFLEPTWAKHSKGSTFDSVSSDDIKAVEIDFPTDVDEQAAIASVLSDMDAEIAALEARHDKTRDLKQAMMQELLTGRTRLVQPEVAHA